MRACIFSTLIILLSACSTPAKRIGEARIPAAMPHSMNHEMTPTTEYGDYDEEALNKICQANGWTDAITPDQQVVVTEMFGRRSHRLQHALWHAMRGTISSEARAQIVKTYGPSADTAYPLCSMVRQATSSPDNPVGEDFLYMHHEMVTMLQTSLAAAGLPCIHGWDTIAETESYSKGNREPGPKGLGMFKMMKAWDEKYFQNPQWLQDKSLSEVGFALEITIHNTLHVRHASGGGASAVVPLDGVFPNPWPYDDPNYNFLPDPYGSAVNPYFWKIHGYVDGIVKAWLAANPKHYRVARKNCRVDESDCYTWRGTWVGVEGWGEGIQPSAGHIRTDEEIKTQKSFDKHRLRLEVESVRANSKLVLPPLDGPITVEDPLVEARNRLTSCKK